MIILVVEWVEMQEARIVVVVVVVVVVVIMQMGRIHQLIPQAERKCDDDVISYGPLLPNKTRQDKNKKHRAPSILFLRAYDDAGLGGHTQH